MQRLARPKLLLAALCLVVVSTPGFGQSIPDQGVQESFGRPMRTLEGAAVPYAVRAEALFSSLARMRFQDLNKGSNKIESFMHSLGLDAETPAVQELVTAAVALERDHPAITAEVKALAGSGGNVDLDRPGGWMDQRYTKVGQALGTWMLRREAENWATEPLLDRLLNGSHISVSLFSDDDPTTFSKRVDRQCKALHDSLAEALGRMPQRFQQQDRSQR